MIILACIVRMPTPAERGAGDALISCCYSTNESGVGLDQILD